MKIVHLESGQSPTQRDFESEKPKLRGCILPIMGLIIIGMLGYGLLRPSASSPGPTPSLMTVSPTNTQTPTQTATSNLTLDSVLGTLAFIQDKTITTTPSSSPTPSPTLTSSMTPTNAPSSSPTKTSTQTPTKTSTPSKTPRPTRAPARVGSGNSNPAPIDSGGCGPCSGSVQGGSIMVTIWQAPSGPETVGEQSIYSPTPKATP